MSRNEADTRKELIDRALETAGWDLDDSDQVGIEIPVDGYDAADYHFCKFAGYGGGCARGGESGVLRLTHLYIKN